MYWAIECPGAAREALASKNTSAPTATGCGADTNDALGGVPALTETCCVVEAETPRLLVTVNVTAKVPTPLNAWVALWPDPVVPSPKFHWKVLMPLLSAHGGVPAQLL